MGLATAFDFRVICYINGILFYPRAVNVSAQLGGFHSFCVDVPAVPQWDILPPRSHCAVFYTDPVTDTWRLMCEGEYDETVRSKQSHGARSRSLTFRALHAYWQTTHYTSMVSAMIPDKHGINLSETIITTQAAGRDFTFEFKAGNEAFRVNSLQSLVDESTVPGKRLAGFMQQFVYKATLQTPVEAFYMVSRNIVNKFHALDDVEINTVCDAQRFRDLATNGFNCFGLGPTSTLSGVVMAYEDLLFYQHTPVLSPPLIENGSKLLELLFIPHLYYTIPPACNVIFSDQVTQSSGRRSFLQEPTRVLTQMGLEIFGTNNPFPQIYMANTAAQSRNFTEFILPDAEGGGLNKSPMLASHGLLSEEELLRGVNATSVNIGLEKLAPDKADLDAFKAGSKEPSALLKTYMEEASRHQYEVERGRVRSQQLSCVFLPYLLVGFPVLVEDPAGPYFGIIDSLTHSMPCQGQPSTIVNVTFMREAYVQEGVDRSSPIPRWLNAAFHPDQVNKTYKNLFGIDSNDARGDQAAMVPDKSIAGTTTKTTTSQQESGGETINSERLTGANLDELARAVVETPKYKADLTAVDDGTSSGQIAKRLRKTPFPDRMFMRFQYRDGISLSQYIKFHNLPVDGSTSKTNDRDAATSPLPEDLAQKHSPGHPLFGSPSGLAFVGRENLDQAQQSGNTAHYGVYDLAPGAGGDKAEISALRQNASQTIKDAISKRLSPN